MVAEKKGQTPPKADAGSVEPAGAAAKRRRAAKPADSHVANALKTAYRETVQEDVPSEFLDLLGKLA